MAFHEEVRNLKRPRVGKTQRSLKRSQSIMSVEDVGDAAAEATEVTKGPVSSSALGPFRVDKHIQLTGNFGLRRVCCTIAGRTDEDSDNEASGGTAESMETHILTVRNNSAKTKHGVTVKASRGIVDAGNGLFADVDPASGHEIVVMGPIFETEEPMLLWMSDQERANQEFLSTSALSARRSLSFVKLPRTNILLHPS